MKKFLSSLCAATMMGAMAVGSVVPVNAAPVIVPQAPSSDVIDVQSRMLYEQNQSRQANRAFRGDRRDFRQDRREFRRDRRDFRETRRNFRRGDVSRRDFRQARRDFRGERREFRGDRRDFRRGFYRNDGYGWYNGHRGYRGYRRGYREYNGFWFPLAAFAAGAIITGAINDGPRYRGGGSAHVQWCYDRWLTYRDWDNTYQPTRGGRRQCNSPYN